MEAAKSKTGDFLRPTETQQSSNCCDNEDSKFHSAKKFTYTFSTQPLETDLKKLLTQVTGKIDLPSITEVKLKVVSGQAGLHRLSEYTPNLRILILDGSCISSFRDLGSSLKSLATLSVSRCSMKHLDGVSGFLNLEDLNASENFVSDPSPCSSVRKLWKLDLSRNQVTDVSYFAFLRSCRKLRDLRVAENHFSEYREEMKTLLPQIKILDGEEFEDCLQPEVPYEEGFLLANEDLSSEDESSTSFSLEEIVFEETQPTDYADDDDDDDDEKKFSLIISESDLNSTQNSSKILQEEDDKEEEEEEEEENFEKTVNEHRLTLNDSGESNIDAKSTGRETSSIKLSSSRVIGGNLAISLRESNPLKSPSSAMAQVKNDLRFGEEENNEKECQEEVQLENVELNCLKESGNGDYWLP